ncbi:hypothetical protein EPO05_04905 [Patescibacteria group bacterium]|nr:MAG: hypothetical protein EPO05_04905 [Patescibacteria group bacterium]
MVASWRSKKSKDKVESEPKHVKFSTVIGIPIALLFMVVLGVGIAAYGFGNKGRLVLAVERVVPYPAAKVGSVWISLGDYNANVASVKQFYENQDFSAMGGRVDFSTPNGEKRLLVKSREVINKMVEDKAIEVLARQRGIVIADEVVHDSVTRKMEENGSSEVVTTDLSRLYGWTVTDFEEKVVRPSMYKDELIKTFQREDATRVPAESKIKEAEAALQQDQEFTAVVAKYSEGATVATGGELGWFTKSQLPPEIAPAIYALKKGERSAPLESSLGFHVIEMEDRKVEDDVEQVRIRQIFVKKQQFADWLGDQMRNIPVHIFIKGFRWGADKQFVEFIDLDMVQFEKTLRENAAGDPSILF